MIALWARFLAVLLSIVMPHCIVIAETLGYSYVNYETTTREQYALMVGAVPYEDIDHRLPFPGVQYARCAR